MNNIKQKISAKKLVLGTWNTMGSSTVTKVIGSSGLDFQIIDLEHGPFIINEIHNHVVSAAYFDCSCFVRIPSNTDWMALQVLDQGAHGIVVPQINNVESAKQFIENTKYFPVGNRGYSPFTLAGGYENSKIKNYTNHANKNIVNIVIIESIEGINNIDEIIKLKEIDVVYIGAFDLSKSLGIPGDIYNSKIVDIVKNAAEKISKAGKLAGSFVPNTVDEVKFCLDLNLKFITYSLDSLKLRDTYIKEIDQIRNI